MRAVEPAIAPLTSTWTRLMTSGLQANATMAEELMGFARERFERDGNFINRVADCGSTLEAIQLYGDWTVDLTRDYLTEGQRLVEIGAQLTEASVIALTRAGEAGR